MVDTDMLLMQASGNVKSAVTDLWSQIYSTPLVDPQQDWIVQDIVYDAALSTVTFDSRRPFDTGDLQDFSIP